MKRYEFMANCSGAPCCIENQEGDWVRWEDVQALKDDLCKIARWYTVALEKNQELEFEVDELKAEIKRIWDSLEPIMAAYEHSRKA